jgi:DNA-binding transcriptional ArsR family regulator
MTAKWTEVTETTVPARVEREETEFELWTHKRSAHRCVTDPATPTEIGRGLQALEPAERAEALEAAGVEPTPPATPEEIGEVLAGLEPDERDRALDVAGVPSATPEELAAVVAALPPDERLRVLRALGAKPAPERTPEALGAELAALDVCEFLRAARAAGVVEARRLPRSSSPPLSVGGVPVMWSEIRVGEGDGGAGLVRVNGAVWLENVLVAAHRAVVLL